MLVDAASGFIAYHLTDNATPELAEDRFHYLLTRIGDLVDLAAEISDVDPSVVVRDVTEGLRELEDPIADDFAGRAYRAAQTCLVAHTFVRKGRPPWGTKSISIVTTCSC